MAHGENCFICRLVLSAKETWIMPKCRHHFHRICIRTVYDESRRRQDDYKSSFNGRTCPQCPTLIDERDLPQKPFADRAEEARRQEFLSLVISKSCFTFKGRSHVLSEEADWLKKEGQRLMNEVQLFKLHSFVHKAGRNEDEQKHDKKDSEPVAILSFESTGRSIRYNVLLSDGSTTVKKVHEMEEEASEVLETFRRNQRRLASIKVKERKRMELASQRRREKKMNYSL